jgi:MFS family permease
VIIWTLASGGSGLAQTFMMLLITRMFVGIGEGAYGPAAPTLISDLFPIEKRGQVLSWFYLAIPVGSALGYTFGGAIGSYLGWRWAFLAVVPPGLLLGAYCFFMPEPQRGQTNGGGGGATKPRIRLADYLSLAKNPSYLLDCAGMTAMTFAIGGISFWMPRYVTEYRQAGSLAHVNTIFGVITVITGIAGTLLGGIVGDKLRPRFPSSYFLVSAIGIFVSCPAILAMLYLPFPYAWGAIFVGEFFLFFNTGPSNTILANVTPPGIRATAFAINILLIHTFGDAFSPPLLGGLAQRSWNLAFYVVILAMMVAGLLWLWGTRFLVGDMQRACVAEPALCDPPAPPRQNATGDAADVS